MYLAAEAPWLKTDAHWTTLYATPVDADANADSSAHVYLAMRRVGKGELVAASQESFLLNEAIKTHPNPVLLDFLAGGRPVIWVDETLHGLHQDQGVLWLVQRYRLQAALLFFWATLLTLLWSLSGDLVRRPPRRLERRGRPQWRERWRRRATPAATEYFGGAGLWRNAGSSSSVARHRMRRPFRADPRWAPRLRAALAQPPLPGYKELTELICERRASAKGLAPLAQADGGRPDSVSASPRTTSEEARIA